MCGRGASLCAICSNQVSEIEIERNVFGNFTTTDKPLFRVNNSANKRLARRCNISGFLVDMGFRLHRFQECIASIVRNCKIDICMFRPPISFFSSRIRKRLVHFTSKRVFRFFKNGRHVEIADIRHFKCANVYRKIISNFEFRAVGRYQFIVIINCQERLGFGCNHRPAIFGRHTQHRIRSIQIYNRVACKRLYTLPARDSVFINRWDIHFLVIIHVYQFCIIRMILAFSRFRNIIINILANLDNLDGIIYAE